MAAGSTILHADLTPGQKLTLIGVRSRQGARDWCYASHRQLADDMGRDHAVITRDLAVLANAGWIQKEGRKLRCLESQSGDEKSPDNGMSLVSRSHQNGEDSRCREVTSVVSRSHQIGVEKSPPSKRQLKLTLKENGARPRKRFVKPTVEEVTDYFQTIGTTNAEKEARKFTNYYETIGWVVGKASKPMVSWKGAAGGWKDRVPDFVGQGKKPATTAPSKQWEDD